MTWSGWPRHAQRGAERETPGRGCPTPHPNPPPQGGREPKNGLVGGSTGVLDRRGRAPLFRLLSYALAQGLGGLARLATVLALASYAALFGAIAAAGHFVAQGRPAAGASRWRRWRGSRCRRCSNRRRRVTRRAGRSGRGSRRWRCWCCSRSGGGTAGPGGWRSRWRRRRRPRSPGRGGSRRARPAWPTSGPTAARGAARPPRCRSWPPRCRPASRCSQAAAHSFHLLRGASAAARAVPEVLVFHNLGLDVPTTPVQGLVLVTGPRRRLGLVAVGRGRAWPRPNPLEASGVALPSRPSGWRPTAAVVAQVGAVVFAAGWWSGLRGDRASPRDPSRLLAPDAPRGARGAGDPGGALRRGDARFRRLGQSRVYPPSPFEAKLFPIPSLQWWRTNTWPTTWPCASSSISEAARRGRGAVPGAGIGRDACGGVRAGRGARGCRASRLTRSTCSPCPRSGRESDPASCVSAVGSPARRRARAAAPPGPPRGRALAAAGSRPDDDDRALRLARPALRAGRDPGPGPVRRRGAGLALLRPGRAFGARPGRGLPPAQRRLGLPGRLADVRRTLENLFVPHNTHVVPTWRVLTWAVSSRRGGSRRCRACSRWRRTRSSSP